MNFNNIRDGKVRIKLTPQTAELVHRYAETDPEGRITKYPIINEEIVAALLLAIERFESEMVLGEQRSNVWDTESPCVGCAEAKGCSITCRLKHQFEKEVYGGLLSGTKPAIWIHNTSDVPKILNEEEYQSWRKKLKEREQKEEVYFKVHLNEETLEIERTTGHKPGAISHTKHHPLVIDHREVSLRPWSMALYRTFINRPAGITLSSLYGESKRDFIRHYERATNSPLKTSKVKELLRDGKGVQHLVNNKLSELNKELRAQGVNDIFMVHSEQFKANNKPYYIRYLKEQISKE